MKIWLVALDAHGGGGVTAHLQSITNGLAGLGHQISLVSPAGKAVEQIADTVLQVNVGAFKPYPCNFSVDVIETWALRLETNLKIMLRTDKPDIIHCHDVIAFNRVKAIAEEYGIPVVLTVHGYLSAEEANNGHVLHGSDEHKYWERTEALALEHAVCTIAVGSELRDYLRKVCPSADITIVPNPINDDFFLNDDKGVAKGIREQIGVPGDGFLVFCPSRFAYNKGVEYLLAAFDEISDRAYLLLVDHGFKMMREELKKYSYLEKVRIIKPVSRGAMPFLYRASDVCVIPSVRAGECRETSSYTAIEAMAAGIPVVASSIGGLKEVVGEWGIMVPERSAKPISDALIALMDKKEWNVWSTKAVERSRFFNCKNIIPKLEEIYGKAIFKATGKAFETPELYGFTTKVLYILFLILLGERGKAKVFLDTLKAKYEDKYIRDILYSLKLSLDGLPDDYSGLL